MEIGAAPAYARIAQTIQQRITDGTYPAGSALPSEAKLSQEFGVSKNPVVRALNMLRQEGWIDSHQGKAYFVRGRPAIAGRSVPEHVVRALDVDETAQVELLHVGPVLASARVAAALRIEPQTPVYERRRVVSGADGPVALGSVFVPVEIAVGTAVAKPEPVSEGLRRHVETHRKVRMDYVVDRIAARMPTKDEAKLLAMKPGTPVLSVLVAGYDAAGTALLASDELLPGNLHELEDVYPLP